MAVKSHLTKTGLAVLALVLGAQAVFADVKTGVDAWTRGEYEIAVKQWREPALKGDPDAQFNMGQAYKMGRGVKTDLVVALDWYKKAAARGHLQAADSYGHLLHYMGKVPESLPYLQASADRGDPRAQYLLGTELFNGVHIEKDWVRAYALMTRASASGLAPASASLGQMDRFIPLDQRQRGLALARDMELTAMRPSLAAGTASMPAAPRPAPSTGPIVKQVALTPADLGMTNKGDTFDEPDVEPVAVRRPLVPKPRPVAVAVAPKPTAKPTTGPAVIAGKGWRVQLGAFGEEGRARALFTNLEGKVAGLSDLQPFLVKAGAVTRLQAGPLASAAAADRMCATVRAAGNACVPVAP